MIVNSRVDALRHKTIESRILSKVSDDFVLCRILAVAKPVVIVIQPDCVTSLSVGRDHVLKVSIESGDTRRIMYSVEPLAGLEHSRLRVLGRSL